MVYDRYAVELTDKDGQIYGVMDAEAREQVSELNSALNIVEVPLELDKAIGTVNAVVLPENIRTSRGWCCTCIPCVSGDKFTIAGSGGKNDRLWCFSDESGTVISKAYEYEVETGLVVTAPEGSAYFAFNSGMSFDGYSVRKGSTLDYEIDSSVGIQSNLGEYDTGTLDYCLVLKSGQFNGYGDLVKSDNTKKELYTENYLRVSPRDKVDVLLKYKEANSVHIQIVEYDENKSFVKSYGLSNETTANYNGTVIIDFGVAYVRVSFASYGDGEYDIKITKQAQLVETEINRKGIELRANMLAMPTGERSPQVVDKDSYPVLRYSASYYYSNAKIELDRNGNYFTNPNGKTSGYNCRLYSADGTVLNGGTAYNIPALCKIVRVDDTHLLIHNYINDMNRFKNDSPYQTQSIETDGVISYMLAEKLYTNTDDFYAGITYGMYADYYVPYGIGYKYSDDFLRSTFDGINNLKYFMEIAEKQLNPGMFRSYAINEDNLLDDRLIDWTQPRGGYYSTKIGTFMPIEGGKQVVYSHNILLDFYDANGESVGRSGYLTPPGPYTIPANAVQMKVSIADSVGQYTPVVVRYVKKYYAYDESKIGIGSLPRIQINGYDINKNIYDYAIPEKESTICRMMKAFSIREVNAKHDAFRIGTFNLFVTRNRSNREVVKKELETYGVDICCFQEARIREGANRINIGDYLSDWHFKYFNANEEDFDCARSVASTLKIVSSEAFILQSNTTNSFLKCVIEMPRYKHLNNGVTYLSLYTYHGYVSSETTRLNEVAEIIAKISEDTSDFIVVTGDTNDFSENKVCWAKFEEAGLTPVHRGENNTVTDVTADESIDNIFYSRNITCLNYDIVDSNEWTFEQNGNQVPVSDHCMVYADLKFDFAAVLAERNANN